MSDSTAGPTWPQAAVPTLLAMVAEYSLDLISVHSPAGEFQYVSPNVGRLFGWTPDALIGHSPFDYFHPEDTQRLRPGKLGARGVVRYRFRTGQGAFRWTETRYHATGDRAHIVAVTRDVQQEQELIERLQRSSTRDALTGLLNRKGLEDALARELERARRGGGELSAIFFDVDGFKQINDTRGHEAGDEVLRRVAAVVLNRGRMSDLPGRWGGDEFLILLPATRPLEAVRVARRIARALKEGGTAVSVSVGISSSAGAATARDLIRQADEAQYGVKRQGGDWIGVYGCPLSSRPVPLTDPRNRVQGLL